MTWRSVKTASVQTGKVIGVFLGAKTKLNAPVEMIDDREVAHEAKSRECANNRNGDGTKNNTPRGAIGFASTLIMRMTIRGAATHGPKNRKTDITMSSRRMCLQNCLSAGTRKFGPRERTPQTNKRNWRDSVCGSVQANFAIRIGLAGEWASIRETDFCIQ